MKFDFRPALVNTERAESDDLSTATTGAPMNLATKRFRPSRCGESAIKTESIGDVVRKDSDSFRLARVLGGGAVLAGLVVLIASCSGNGSNAPSTTQSPTTTTTTQSLAPEAPPPAPTEKSISPTGGNKFTPTVRAPMAPTAIPGNRENTG
jgi:hypothetical protein